MVDTNGLPIAIKLTEGQAHDGRSAAVRLDGLQARQILLADRAYDSDALRDAMTAREYGPTSTQWRIEPSLRPSAPPSLPLQKAGRTLLQQAHAFRAITTGHEKHAANELALVTLAAIRIRLRHNQSVT